MSVPSTEASPLRLDAFALSSPLRSALKVRGAGATPQAGPHTPTPTPTPSKKGSVHESIVASGAKENKGLKQVQWRKSMGGTPLRDPSTRLGAGEMEVALSQALDSEFCKNASLAPKRKTTHFLTSLRLPRFLRGLLPKTCF